VDFDHAYAISFFVAILFSLTIHQAAHAFVGVRLGEDTPEIEGRLTLNPIPHIDLFGTIVLPLLLIVMNTGVLFGWAKPVRTDPRNLKNLRRDLTLIALAGPASNVALALVFALATKLAMQFVSIDSVPPELITFLYIMVMLNVLLAVFNMIPLPPLDGHRLLSLEWQQKLAAMGPIFIILIVFVLFRPLYDYIIGPMTNVLINFMFAA
jgi:Zn-dependent protease